VSAAARRRRRRRDGGRPRRCRSSSFFFGPRQKKYRWYRSFPTFYIQCLSFELQGGTEGSGRWTDGRTDNTDGLLAKTPSFVRSSSLFRFFDRSAKKQAEPAKLQLVASQHPSILRPQYSSSGLFTRYFAEVEYTVWLVGRLAVCSSVCFPGQPAAIIARSLSPPRSSPMAGRLARSETGPVFDFFLVCESSFSPRTTEGRSSARFTKSTSAELRSAGQGGDWAPRPHECVGPSAQPGSAVR